MATIDQSHPLEVCVTYHAEPFLTLRLEIATSPDETDDPLGDVTLDKIQEDVSDFLRSDWLMSNEERAWYLTMTASLDLLRDSGGTDVEDAQTSIPLRIGRDLGISRASVLAHWQGGLKALCRALQARSEESEYDYHECQQIFFSLDLPGLVWDDHIVRGQDPPRSVRPITRLAYLVAGNSGNSDR